MGRRFWVEQLEPRCLLSVNTTQTATTSIFDLGVMLGNPATGVFNSGSPLAPAGALVIDTMPPPPPSTDNGGSLANGALLAVAPFPLEETFFLHSVPGATKVIYLDFDGFITRDTSWNTGHGLPNIVTPAYSLDGDFATFSEAEQLVIQSVWEHASEDFRPFNVDVTTQDPGVEALKNTGGADDAWGIRVAIGGSTFDWFTPTDPAHFVAGGVAGGPFGSNNDTPCFVFAADFGAAATNIAEVVSHEVGHTLGLAHDGQDRFYFDTAAGDYARVGVDYYPGHGFWAPIMGVGYGKTLTQWSKGEYPGATNVPVPTPNTEQDDLAIITTQNGFGYRTDDHGSTIATADTLDQDPLTADFDTNLFTGEGVIERNTDVDFFSFTVEGLGELVSFDIEPFHNGPNLDVLAKLYDSSGAVIATSNPLDDLNAIFSEQALWPGTYYISIEGAGRPITFIDPTFHPGPFMADGNPPDPPLPDDLSDWGYTNYGSLGYFSITGTLKKGLVVGVDFDEEGGTSPENWNLYSGGDTQTVLTNLISEAGDEVPYQLSISTTGPGIEVFPSDNGIDSADLPNHGLPLDGLDGYIDAVDETLTFVWSNLDPSTVYQVYVFGHADFDASNVVTVVGGQWNGVEQTYNFTQTISPDGLVVNGNAPGNQDLTTFALLVISNELGEITINVTNEVGSEAAIAGLAIAPTKNGSIEGQKWNDVDGNQLNDPGESGLEGWIIYLDKNNDGQLNSTADQNITVSAPDLPQVLQDYASVKSELFFTEVGQIVDVNVSLDIAHTYDADLTVYLISPAGTRVKLFADVGGSSDNFLSTTLDDEATTDIGDGVAPFLGHFRPQEPLSAYIGENSQGTWQLEITDDSINDTGVLGSWSISVKLAGVFLEPFTVTDVNGNYSFTDLPAGLYYVREHFLDQQTEDGWRQTWAPSPVTVRSGANVKDIDFGNWIPVIQHGSIQGQKFSDVNGDGVKGAQEPGLGGWIIYLDSNENGVRDIATTPATLAAAGLPTPIADFSTVTSQVTFGNLGTVFNVEVTLDITHSFVGDLDAYLISPSGRQVELFTGVGGQYNDFQNLTLADNAARSIATLGVDDVPYTGTWQPEGLLSDFIGDDAAGIWTLLIRDTQFADEGTLNSWSLKITSGELYRVTDANGNYSIDDLPAGEYVVREEPQPIWTQIPPATTDIPGAEWANSQWTVTIVGIDDPSDPDGPDSHRNVKNVDFGNQAVQPLDGDFDRSGVVDAADYILWRKTLGTSVSPYGGADGNGNGVIDSGDYGVWRTNFGRYIDDHGNNAPMATSISAVPSTKSGILEVPGDVDWFKFTAAAGSTYDLETVLGTLSDSVLRLIDSDGVTELDQNDNSVGLESLITWTAPADGIYFAEVRGAASQIGSYDFSISLNGSDDHGNDAGAATAITVPSTTAGEIEVSFDVDWFRFNAISGTSYQFDTVLGTLSDSVLRLIDKDGTTELVYDDDGGVGFASHIDWTAPSSGTYYIEVSGYGSDFGTYDLTSIAAGAGSGSSLSLSFAALSSAPAASSGLLPAGPVHFEAAGSLASSAEADSQGTAAVLDFAAFSSELPAASGRTVGSPFAAGTANNAVRNDAAVVAWMESLAAGRVDLAFKEDGEGTGDIGGENGGDGLFSSVDSIFDKLGAAAFAAGCAV